MSIANARMSEDAAVVKYGVSRDMLKWRKNVARVDRQMRRRKALVSGKAGGRRS